MHANIGPTISAAMDNLRDESAFVSALARSPSSIALRQCDELWKNL